MHTRAAEEKLRLRLGTRVAHRRAGAQGARIEIDFGSEDELNRLYEHLTRDGRLKARLSWYKWMFCACEIWRKDLAPSAGGVLIRCQT